jgi:hypothetical protein
MSMTSGQIVTEAAMRSHSHLRAAKEGREHLSSMQLATSLYEFI